MYVQPTEQATNKTATVLKIRCIQTKLGGLTVDGDWGAKTAAAIQAKRKKLGWEETTG